MSRFNLNSFVAGWCAFAAVVMFTQHRPGMGLLDLLFAAMNLAMAMRKV